MKRESKVCPKCGVTKSPENFYVSPKSRGDHLQPYCKPCSKLKQREWIVNNPAAYAAQKKRQRLRRYNMTPEQFDLLLEEQGGGCAICGTDITAIPTSRLSVDHDHSCCSGKGSCGKCIRGILCTNCNSGLGHFRDSHNLLIAAARYMGGAIA